MTCIMNANTVTGWVPSSKCILDVDAYFAVGQDRMGQGFIDPTVRKFQYYSGTNKQ